MFGPRNGGNAGTNEFKDLRVLVVSSHGADVLRTVFAMMGVHRIAVALSGEAAIQMLSGETYAAPFFDETVESQTFVQVLQQRGITPLLFQLCSGPDRAG
jgi:hypothetical protein